MKELIPQGDAITGLDVGFVLTFETSRGGRLQLGSPFQIVRDGIFVDMDPERLQSFSAAESLVTQVVSRSTVRPSGELIIEFIGGDTLRSGPDPEFEAWEFCDPSGAQTVCLPGGGVAHWPPPNEK